MINIFSFFSGAGFLDLGFELQGNYDILFVNEYHKSFNRIKDELMRISGEENPVESVSIAKLKEMKNRLSSGYTSFWS